MSESRDPLPKPDFLRGEPRRPVEPKVDIWNDPLNPDPVAGRPPASGETPKAPPPSHGLGELDVPHAFASVLGSGIGRVAGVILICMLWFGITEACYRVSLLTDGWHSGGFKGFFSAVFDVPAAIFRGPGHWFVAMGDGLTTPSGVPYLLLVVGGIILAVRSEIHVLRLLLFYGLLTAAHTAAYLKMTNVVSLLLLVAAIVGFYRLYRWLWAQQLQDEDFTVADPAPEGEE